MKKDKKLRDKKPNQEAKRVKTEKVIILASAVMILSALTATGIYLRGQQTPEEITIDLSQMEKNVDDKAREIAGKQNDNKIEEAKQPAEAVSERGQFKNSNQLVENQQKEDDLDYDPEFVEDITIEENQEGLAQKEEGTGESQKTVDSEVKQQQAYAENAESELHFGKDSAYAFPVAGHVIMNYSMDGTVYYETLNQYKYQPGIVMEAKVGDAIAAAADAKVTQIKQDAVNGVCVTMELGDGYELIYGQLDNLKVKEGSQVKQGDIIGTVAEPTKYYAKEGSNLYVQMNKDGVPVNPLTLEP